ncbi:Sialic acid TRAP transporter permease protein SiaT [Shimia sp. SK013]|uniref:TRAP transporter large permease subunit n=1 Tax=Shimia sp. SK013 TaxID=1389006 RepID=UPI0006B632E4|nr:TRAP transporter large permease subunit [Shimia sp. SK013]KPA21288.1 Sialic acid TRAP transporter permease protein SiaT [Shimia sp. SK013]
MTAVNTVLGVRSHGSGIALLELARRIAMVPAAAGAAWTCAIAVLICSEVIARSVFNNPLTGLTEFIALSVPPVVFLQLPMLLLTGKLFRVELFTGPLDHDNPRHAPFGITYAIVLLAVFALFGPWVGSEAIDAYIEGDYVGSTGAFAISTWPFLAIVVFGVAASALAAVALLAVNLTTLLGDGGLARSATWRVGVLLLTMAGFAVFVAIMPTDPLFVGATFIAALFIFLMLGFPIATILIVLSALGIYLIRENFRVTEVAIGVALTRSIANFEFAVVPLFVAMGLVLDKARLGEDAFSVAAYLLRRVRGGLAISTVIANAIFASVVGSSIASAAVFSRVAVGPMISAGYSPRRAVGTVAGSSVLGMLIPPSLLLIVFGLTAEQSIGQLFVAAIVPGLLLACAFAVVAWLLAPKNVKASANAEDDTSTDVPRVSIEDSMSLREIASRLGPVALLVALVLGGIYSGWFTPTEAAGVGLAAAIVIAMVRRTITLSGLGHTALEAGLISSAMLILMAAASAYTRLLAFSRLPMELDALLQSADLQLMALMFVVIVVALLLGSVLDSVSIILVLTPIALPLIIQAGADPIWFGVVLVIAVEVGLLTPPFGLSAYTVREVLSRQGVTLTDVFIGAMPFVGAMLAIIGVLVCVPEIVTMFR